MPTHESLDPRPSRLQRTLVSNRMASTTELIESALGPGFSLERELSGGMARVFVARDERFGRRVVMKLVGHDVIAPDAVARFRREIQFAMGLQHPHIVPILQAGEVDGMPWLVMPFVEGESLRVRTSAGPLELVEAVRVLRGVALALAYAHSRGVIHRDIKPDNVLLAAGTPMVADFGIAKAMAGAREDEERTDTTLTRAGTTLGSPAYMAPEQIAADPKADHRVDIYSFGALAYEMLTGRPPFEGTSPQQLFVAHLTESPVRLSHRRGHVPVALVDLIMRCLAKEPEDRPQSAADLATALESPDMVSGRFEGTTVTSTSTIRSLWPMPAYVRTRRWIALGIALALALAFAAWAWLREPARESAVAGVTAAPPVVAVLPFAFIGADSSDRYIADVITDETTHAVSRGSGARVVARTAAAHLQQRIALGEPVEPAVRAYVEGAVIREDATLRVAVRVVNAATGLAGGSTMIEGRADSLTVLSQRVAADAIARIHAELAADSLAAQGRK